MGWSATGQLKQLKIDVSCRNIFEEQTPIATFYVSSHFFTEESPLSARGKKGCLYIPLLDTGVQQKYSQKYEKGKKIGPFHSECIVICLHRD